MTLGSDAQIARYRVVSLGGPATRLTRVGPGQFIGGEVLQFRNLR